MTIWDVHVEWMDGVKRSYVVGGYAGRRSIQEGDGVLVLCMGNSQFGEPEHVATIPLSNVREYKAVPR